MSVVAALILVMTPVAADPRIAELKEVESAITTGHRYPWHSTSEAQFEEARVELARRLPVLTAEAARFELARWIAAIGDGHTLVPLLPLSQDDFCDGQARRFLPLRFEWFAEGLYIVGSARNLAHLLGQQVIRLGDRDVEAALKLAMEALPRRSPGFAREYAPEWLMSADVLAGGSMLDNRQALRVQTAAGETTPVGLVACHAFDWLHSRTAGPLPAAEWLSIPSPREGYSGEHLAVFETEGTEGLRIFELRVDDRANAEASFLDLLSATSRNGPFLIDLRDTVGGDGTLVQPFLAALERHFGEDWARKVLVLQGRRTHSAGIMLLSALRRQGVRSFGQATGDAPSHYGETEVLPLPAFDSVLLYASSYYDTDHPGDRRAVIAPDQAVPFTFRDFAAGRDRAIERAIAAYGEFS